jgi:hypothetical protein
MKSKNVRGRGLRDPRTGFLKAVAIDTVLPVLFDPAKGDPVNNRLIHPHHQGRCDDEFAVFVIDPVHFLRNCMRWARFSSVEPFHVYITVIQLIKTDRRKGRERSKLKVRHRKRSLLFLI